MHFDGGRQQVVHDNDANILLVALVAKHAKEFGQESVRVLVEVHVVSRQQFLKKLRLFVLHRFYDELVVVGQEKHTPRGARIA